MENKWKSILVKMMPWICLLAVVSVPSAAICYIASGRAMIMFWMFLAVVGFCIGIIKKWEKLLSEKLLKQIAWILFFVTFFIGAALLSPVPDKTNLKWILFDVGTLLVLDGTLLWLFYQKNYFRRSPITFLKEKYKNVVTDHFEILLGLLLLFAERVWMIGTLQRWDAGEYYYRLGTACTKFDFSFGSYLEHFRLCRHPTLGMTLITAPGEFLNHRGVVGVMIINLILTLAAAYCLYQMLRGFFGKMSKGMAAASTVLCFSIPLMWGTFSYYNPDYFIAIFMIFFMYHLYRKNYVSMVFWGVMASQCKETGLVIVFGYALVRVFALFVAAKGGFVKRFLVLVKDAGNWCSLAVGVIYLIYAKYNGGLTSWKQTSTSANTTFTWSNTGKNCFGFQPGYIMTKIEQMFVMNYAWLFWGAAVLLVLVLVVRRVILKKRSEISWVNLAGPLGAMAVYFGFTSLYVTACIYRYNVLFVLFTAVLFCILFVEVIGKKVSKVFAGTFVVLMLLMGVQTFATTDPISNAVVPSVTTGTGEKMLFSAYDSDYYGDYLVYNYQYTWIDKAYDKLLRAVGYDGNTQIVLVGSEVSGTHINGNGSAYSMFWNLLDLERTMMGGEDTIEISTVSTGSLKSTKLAPHADKSRDIKRALRDKAVVIFLPHYGENEEEALAILEPYYYVGGRNVIQEGTGDLIYYHLYLKPEYDGYILEKDAYDGPIPFDDVPFESCYKNELVSLMNLDVLAQYVDITEDTVITDWDVEWEIRNRLWSVRFNQEVADDRQVVRFGDEVSLTYDCYVDGVALMEESVAETVYIGSGTYVEGIEEQLIGSKVGEEVRFAFTFPDDYNNAPELSGKEAQMVAVVDDIVTELPGLTNEMIWNYTEAFSIDEYRSIVRAEMEVESKKATVEEAVEKFVDLLVATSQYTEIEDNILHSYLIKARGFYEEYCAKIGVPFAALIENYVQVSEVEFNQMVQSWGQMVYKEEVIQNALEEYLYYSYTDEYGQYARQVAERLGYESEFEFYDSVTEEEANRLIQNELIYQKFLK